MSRRLPLRFQLLVGICVLIVLIAASIAVAAFSIFSLRQDQEQLQDHNVPYAVAVATAALNAKGMANDERGFLISGNREFLEELDQRLINVRTAFAAASSAADSEVQRQAVSEAHAGFERWVAALRREFKIFRAGDRESATSASLGPGRALRKEYEASLADAQTVAKTAIRQRRNSFASSAWVMTLLALLLVVLAIAFGVTFWLTRTVGAITSAAETPDPTPAPIPLTAHPADRLRRRNG